MKFTENVSIAFIAKVLLFLIGIPTTIIIARVLGPTGQGIYALIFLIPTLLLLLSNLGIGLANTYFVGSKRAELSDTASNSMLFGFGNGLLIIGLFLLLYSLFLRDIFFKEVDPLFVYVIALVIPFGLIKSYFTGILYIKFKIKEINLILVSTSLATLIGTALLLLVFHQGIFSLVLLYVLVNPLACLASVLLVRKLTSFKFSFNWGLFKKSVNFGIKGYLSNVLSFLCHRLDMFLIVFFIGVTPLGYYSIAVIIAELLWYIPNSIAAILFPEVASSDRQRSNEITKIMCRNALFLTFLSSVVLALIAKILIEGVFGAAYLPAVTPLLVLLPGIVLGSISGIMGGYFPGIGRPVISLYGTMIVVVIDLILNLILIPRMGITGAALATSISYSLGSIYTIFMFLRLSKSNLMDTLIIKSSDFRFYSGFIKALLPKLGVKLK